MMYFYLSLKTMELEQLQTIGSSHTCLTGNTLLTECISQENLITYGYPQGSINGPTFFLIMTNDLQKCLKYVKSICFADDTTAYITYHNKTVLYRRMRHDLRILEEWLKANSLLLNVDKTYAMLFKPIHQQ